MFPPLPSEPQTLIETQSSLTLTETTFSLHHMCETTCNIILTFGVLLLLLLEMKIY